MPRRFGATATAPPRQRGHTSLGRVAFVFTFTIVLLMVIRASTPGSTSLRDARYAPYREGRYVTLTAAERQRAYRQRKKGTIPERAPTRVQAVAVDTSKADDRVWQGPFLAAFRASGNVRLACQAAGISRARLYKVREQDAEFRAAIEEAAADAHDMLAAEARRRALADSDTMLIYMLKVTAPKGPDGDLWRRDRQPIIGALFEDNRTINTGMSYEELQDAARHLLD